LNPSLPDIERCLRAGEHLWYNEAYRSARRDLYLIDKVRYQALDQVCPDPTSRCSTVDISFWTNSHPADPYPGTVMVNASGRSELIPSSAVQRERLRTLWKLFRARHPNYIERCARRTAGVRKLGATFLTPE
jgi:hypothetical protein